jgi:hypothetical protein
MPWFYIDSNGRPAGFSSHKNEESQVFSDTEQPEPYEILVDGVWVVDLVKLKEVIIMDLKTSCNLSCRAGFVSSQLGSPYFYETEKDRDQMDLIALSAAAIKNMDTPGWVQTVTCTSMDGVKARRLHTANQLAELGEEIQKAISDNKDALFSLFEELEAAYLMQDEAGMRAVAWVV